MAQAATAAVPVRQYRFTADEFEQMGRAGIFHEDQRLELVDGIVLEMSPIGTDHAACVDRLNRILSRCVGDRAIVRVQGPVRLGLHSESMPDLAILNQRDDFYARAHPQPDDILLIIEVADTTVEYDRDTKMPLYATAGIPEAWLVDLEDETITAYREPTTGGFRQQEQYHRGHRIKSVSVPGLEVDVAAVLGRR
jgi:hypothetical protein